MNNPCPVCSSPTDYYDVVDFNRICLEEQLGRQPLSGIPIYYCLCNQCGFLHAPAFKEWSDNDFLQRIYNADYLQFDPGYAGSRSADMAHLLEPIFARNKDHIRHLDYGGGNGELSRLLAAEGWNSTSFDPFPQPDKPLASLGEFNLITAIEVFEHVPNPYKIMGDIMKVTSDKCVILFTTLLNDDCVEAGGRLDWWYAAPRNGHISLFSSRSLAYLAATFGLEYISIDANFHLFFTDAEWLDFLIETQSIS